jgi:hypothetical protein
MFIDDFVSVASDILVANAWLLSHGAEIAREAADATVTTQSFIFGPPRSRSEALVVPIAWTAAPRAAFVELQGDLETSRLDGRTTHLGLSASCDLAVDAPGLRNQGLAAQRAAEQSVREFLEHVGVELERRGLGH